MTNALMKLFIAIPLPDALAQSLCAVRSAHPGVERGNLLWESRSRLHATLRFLGEVDDVGAVLSTLSGVRAAPARCAVGPRTGRFGRSLLHAPVAGLDDLAERVVAATAHIGKPPDRRVFNGHITLARCSSGAVLPAGEVDIPGELYFVADHFALMQSEVVGQDSVYTLLEKFPLRGDSPATEDVSLGSVNRY